MLQDRFGRAIDYLRVSVTDRCDLRCSYCLPARFKGFEEPAHWLTFDEIERLVGAFTRLGVRRVRLTGGEPLLRRNLPELAGRLRGLGLDDLSLSTNATQLAKHAQALKDAGVTRVNVSLDSLDRQCVSEITGSDSFDQVMAGLRAAKAVGLAPIKLNMVAMQGVNDAEINTMADFAFENGYILRMIEAMPMGDTGRNAQYLDLGPIRDRLVERYDLIPEVAELGGGPARYWQTRQAIAGHHGKIGFITPISQHFCASCNRVRLTVDGTLYMCLGQESAFEFRPLLRGGASDAELEAAILHAIELKPERHEFIEQPTKLIRFMSQTGG
ncbi:GTP 3',8-cyclase MoaA [Chitinibacter bivalviorum]|uniref:GTP 3',8-cyclase n=1 Tax=Chitinibacter bivalviorum TaxID=2739434 RepID=A0A7H9BKK9_9NEIS|nr:GTP 3',8-cyclase MoaA [Chitinibacter bivalviorum]QLG88856.1 GTP 3',8-cyclase MoaA [Chitinibacter bivalviorum]